MKETILTGIGNWTLWFLWFGLGMSIMSTARNTANEAFIKLRTEDSMYVCLCVCMDWKNNLCIWLRIYTHLAIFMMWTKCIQDETSSNVMLTHSFFCAHYFTSVTVPSFISGFHFRSITIHFRYYIPQKKG